MKSYSTWRSATAYLTLTSMVCMACTFNPQARANTEANAPAEIQHTVQATHTTTAGTLKIGKRKIKIALLLDTSNSMDGLIDQAKAQLWKLVNELALAKCGDERPMLEIALYEYGNSGLPMNEGYIRQVAMFTDDLDLISEKLFSLTTNGGDEFCGQVIQSATTQLDWTGDDNDLRLIFIAGNEPFTQGSVNYAGSCKTAKQKDIVVNTIYCGSFDEGLGSGWKNGALLADGSYMSIEQDRKTEYIETPYDQEIAKLNDKLNDTYVSYGAEGYSKKQNQVTQDANASSYGISNTTSRVASKASAFYSNASWDLVDASREKDFDVTKMKESELPKEIQGKNKAEKEAFIQQKSKEREDVRSQILVLNKKRMEYIAEKQKASGDTNSLDAAMIKAIKEQAARKNFTFQS